MGQFAVASHSPPSTSSQEWRNSNNPHCPATAKRSILRLRDATTWDANANQAALQLRPTTETAMTLECVTGLTTKINPKTMRMLDAAHHAPHAAIQQYSNTAIQKKSAALRIPQDSASIISRPYFLFHRPHSTATVSAAHFLEAFTASTALFREAVRALYQSVCSLSLSVADLKPAVSSATQPS